MKVKTSIGVKPEVQILSQNYLDVNALNPRETVWSSGGRPIYDRLPAAGEAYKRFFSLGSEQGYVYIPESEGSEGPLSLRVVPSDDGKKILIMGGISLWEYGHFEHPPVYIDLEQTRLRSSKYLLAYQMAYSQDSSETYEEVQNFPINGLELLVQSNTDSLCGWRFSPENAFSSDPDLIWKSRDSTFTNQPNEPYIRWNYERDFIIGKLEIVSPDSYKTPVGSRADLYIDSEFSSSSIIGTSGDNHIIYLDNDVAGKTWEIRFTDENIAVQEIRMNGKFPSLYKPSTPRMIVNLVAYSAYNYPKGDFRYCKLAHVDIDEDYRIVGNVEDLRDKVFHPFQPVADWLTRPWDDLLMSLYSEHRGYVKGRMDPRALMSSEYSHLSKSGLDVILPEESPFAVEVESVSGGAPSAELPSGGQDDLVLDGGSPGGSNPTSIDGGAV